MTFVRSFQLSVTRALRDQLLTALEDLDVALLTEANLGQIEERAGVYQLFLNGELVYVGKAARNLRDRLRQHRKKLSGRTRDVLAHTEFKCVYVSEDLDAIAPEAMLIAHYRENGEAPWNFNGFGNKDPGKQRDTSVVKSAHFDSNYPIDLDARIDYEITEGEALATAMERLKRLLPFTFRFDRVPKNLTVSALTGEDLTIRDFVGHLAAALPTNWSIVALPGYLIAYPDRPETDFSSRIGAWGRDAGGTVSWIPNDPDYDTSDSRIEADPEVSDG